jgi:hypothetical protein
VKYIRHRARDESSKLWEGSVNKDRGQHAYKPCRSVVALDDVISISATLQSSDGDLPFTPHSTAFVPFTIYVALIINQQACCQDISQIALRRNTRFRPQGFSTFTS